MLVLKNGIVFVMPRLYLEAVAASKKALAKDRHRVISLKWEFDGIGLKGLSVLIQKTSLMCGLSRRD